LKREVVSAQEAKAGAEARVEQLRRLREELERQKEQAEQQSIASETELEQEQNSALAIRAKLDDIRRAGSGTALVTKALSEQESKVKKK
jgi:hypothetical protein